MNGNLRGRDESAFMRVALALPVDVYSAGRRMPLQGFGHAEMLAHNFLGCGLCMSDVLLSPRTERDVNRVQAPPPPQLLPVPQCTD